jgi:hypothetical protein
MPAWQYEPDSCRIHHIWPVKTSHVSLHLKFIVRHW